VGKISLVGLSRVLLVDGTIVLCSALLGVSLNRSFVAGPQESYFSYSGGEGKGEFKRLSPQEARVDTQVWAHVPLSEVKDIVTSKSMILVDGRSEKDYENGHIPGAYSLSVADFDTRFAGLADRFPKDSPLLIYCGSGQCGLSTRLAERLKEKGYAKLKVYAAGYNDWFLAGNPVEKGKGPSWR
jgi:rhodanese-related sulfurtransferase